MGRVLQNIALGVYCLLFWMSGWSVMVWYGYTLVQEAQYFEKHLNEEECLIVDSSANMDCNYDCNCTHNDGIGKHCELCHGKLYRYEVTIEDRCGDDLLITTDWQSRSCPQQIKEINTTYACYTLECTSDDTTFDPPHKYEKDGIGFMVTGSFFILLPVVCTCATLVCRKCGL
eukprot:221686_1